MLFLNIATGVLGLIALPLLSPLSRLLSFVVESQSIGDSRGPESYLDSLLLLAPSLALNQAARRTEPSGPIAATEEVEDGATSIVRTSEAAPQTGE
jgi:Na+/phosphate symporter